MPDPTQRSTINRHLSVRAASALACIAGAGASAAAGNTTLATGWALAAATAGAMFGLTLGVAIATKEDDDNA